jgi:hypothetical protein
MLQVWIFCDHPACTAMFKPGARCARNRTRIVADEARRNGWMITRDVNSRAIDLCPSCAGKPQKGGE